MAEYIERESAIDAIMAVYVGTAGYKARERVFAAEEAVQRLPVADVAPVVRGRWGTPHWHNSDYCYNCSKCGREAIHREYQWARKGIYPICPNCGAKMDGKDGEDNAVD